MTPDDPQRLPVSDERPLPRPLPERLRAVAGLVPAGLSVVDVGAGAGLVTLWLLSGGRASDCIAIEREGAVGRELARWGDSTRLTVRLGDGLGALRPEDRPQVLVMSGLGARAMLSILEDGGRHRGGLRRLVLQPQTETGLLRSWLVRHGLSIVDERMTRDRGRFYTVIAAEPRAVARPEPHPTLSEDDLLQAGPCLVRSSSPVVRAYWEQMFERTDRLVRRAGPGDAHPRTVAERALAGRVLAALNAGRGSQPK